jgi:hypothetical protein
VRVEDFVVSERIAFLLFVLPLSVYSFAQEGTVAHRWTEVRTTLGCRAELIGRDDAES